MVPIFHYLTSQWRCPDAGPLIYCTKHQVAWSPTRRSGNQKVGLLVRARTLDVGGYPTWFYNQAYVPIIVEKMFKFDE